MYPYLKRSETETAMHLTRVFLIAGGLVAATVVSGCVGKYKSDFPVVVVNRAANAILVLANGNQIGQVAAGQTGSFSLQLPETNPNQFSNGVPPTPQSEVTFSAKDTKTGVVSTAQTMTLSANSPTYVTFSVADFPPSGPTVARMTFSPPMPGLNEVVSFSASTSTVSGGTYAWDFGDGTTGSGVAVTHQYPRANTFTVTLTVTSDTGVVSTASRTITVSTTLPPQAAQFTISPTVPAVNQDVFFNASTSTVTGGTLNWDFGDGGTAVGITVTHRYARAATYFVTLRVSNSVGQSAASSRTVSVAAISAQVVASFTFSPTTPGINQDVFFNGTASVPSNATFTWNFGDGSTGSGVTPTHRYTQAGTYSVTLTVTNDVGQSSTTARNVPVSATSTSIVADFSFSPTDPTISRGTNTVIFDATPSSPAVTTWTWDFGDGSAAGAGQRTSHTFSQPGTWVVRLIVGDAAGRTATTTKNVTVCGSISATGGCAP